MVGAVHNNLSTAMSQVLHSSLLYCSLLLYIMCSVNSYLFMWWYISSVCLICGLCSLQLLAPLCVKLVTNRLYFVYSVVGLWSYPELNAMTESQFPRHTLFGMVDLFPLVQVTSLKPVFFEAISNHSPQMSIAHLTQ
jgi:hypothetical protein